MDTVKILKDMKIDLNEKCDGKVTTAQTDQTPKQG
jgi:hypothetical protein